MIFSLFFLGKLIKESGGKLSRPQPRISYKYGGGLKFGRINIYIINNGPLIHG